MKVALILTLTLTLAAMLPTSLAAGAAVSNGEAERSSRRHFERGEAHYAAGRFAEALAEYQEGYDANPLPGFLVNIAQCHRRLGDLKHARASYQKFVLVAPDSPLVPEVRSLIAEVDRLLAESEGAAPETKNERDPASAGGEKPGAGDDVLGPGGAPASLALPVAPQLNRPGVDLTKAPVGTAEAADTGSAPASSTATHRRWWLWGALGIAVVGGTVATIAALSSKSDPTTLHEGTLGTLRR